MQILIAQPQRLKALAERQSFLFSHCTVTHPSRILPCSAEVFTVQVQISTSVALYFERFPKSNGLNGSWSFLVDFAEWVTRLSSGTFVSIDRDYKSSTNPSHWYKRLCSCYLGSSVCAFRRTCLKKTLTVAVAKYPISSCLILLLVRAFRGCECDFKRLLTMDRLSEVRLTRNEKQK